MIIRARKSGNGFKFRNTTTQKDVKKSDIIGKSLSNCIIIWTPHHWEESLVEKLKKVFANNCEVTVK